MNRLTFTAFNLTLLFALATCGPTLAWEVELKQEVVLGAAMVRLGDIGRITGVSQADAEVLQQLVLAPGPSRSYTRTLSSSQVRKIMSGRGVEMEACHFAGASRCVIVHDSAVRKVGNATSSPRSDDQADRLPGTNPWKLVRPASYRARGGSAVVEGMEQKLTDAVHARIEQLSGDSRPWHIDVSVPVRALNEIPKQWEGLTVEGLDSVAEGRHQLVACFASDVGDVRVAMEAVATRMVELVVPVRPLQRGDVVTAADVELRYVAGRIDPNLAVRRIDEVVGQQLQLPARVGEPLRARSLKRPILVKRREIVTVASRRGPITVRTKVRAIDDGSLGDTIAVERLENGKNSRFLARVVGIQQVEVCASHATTQRVAQQ